MAFLYSTWRSLAEMCFNSGALRAGGDGYPRALAEVSTGRISDLLKQRWSSSDVAGQAQGGGLC